MTKQPAYLDCCEKPDLTAIRTLYSSSDDLESLQRCGSCGAHWFYRFHEWTNWATGDDDLTSWYTPLTEDEATTLRDTPDRDGMDLSYLRTRPCWMADGEGARRVPGAPDHPYS